MPQDQVPISSAGASGNGSPIGEIIGQLQQLIQWSRDNDSRIGYFASLYLRVTATIENKIGTGFFEDDKRLETLDFNFASRYLEALGEYRKKNPDLQKSWAVAFEATRRSDLIIVQQLLAAMNAHINIDLAAACAKTAPGEAIHNLQNDFLRVNQILAALVPGSRLEEDCRYRTDLPTPGNPVTSSTRRDHRRHGPDPGKIDWH